MAGAGAYSSVADAVADCTLVVGTTAVGERVLHHELVVLEEGAARVRGELRRNPTVDGAAVEHGAPGVAILFGSEKTGLSNEELSHCNWLMTIPMHEHEGVRHPSMNLGHAVAVCLYELVREDVEPTSQKRDVGHPVGGDPVAAAQLERITALMTEVMEHTEYTRRHAHNCSPDHVRRLVRRIGVDAVDAPVWIGFLKQVLWKLTGRRGE